MESGKGSLTTTVTLTAFNAEFVAKKLNQAKPVIQKSLATVVVTPRKLTTVKNVMEGYGYEQIPMRSEGLWEVVDMTNRKRWRTRTTGTAGQVGQKYPVLPHGDKSSLPKDLRVVTPSYTEVHDERRETVLKNEIENLEDDLKYAVEMEEYQRAELLAKRLEYVQSSIEKSNLTTKGRLLNMARGVQDKLERFAQNTLDDIDRMRTKKKDALHPES